MTWGNKVEQELCDKMDALLQEAKEKGYFFEFNMGSSHNSSGLISIWSDEDSFCFDIIKSN